MDARSSPEAFPDLAKAPSGADGLVAVGGDLGLERLLFAYRHAIFPWYVEEQPILWWSPDPRAVLWPSALHLGRTTRRRLRNAGFSISINQDFERVVRECAAPRASGDGTWITPEMVAAYETMHRAGYVHSIECRQGGVLVGGLYGVAIGAIFSGESMFCHADEASRAAMAHLCALGFELIDCQVPNPHLTRLGAVRIPRLEYLSLLEELRDRPSPALPPPSASKAMPLGGEALLLP
ncbi:MAG: leucyl/phenylalanyl-tRNA--protein transferase [Ectothiorhodospiraceae bacterium AqS1]|nr:leucyl/phenylalanyl-tRNA--protein transferase [Ectothiorhodospiraceae bacterium AqS1]